MLENITYILINEMIPKIIHYCWFGKEELPPLALKCIESWKKYMPDYEIKRWDEDNYDIRKNQYISQAYDARKYAFVSDYVRFDILYTYGGIYLDTDVEVIKDLTPIIEQGAFAGMEQLSGINSGLGIAAPSSLEIYKEILDSYKNDTFINQEGKINLKTVVVRVSEIFKKHGFIERNEVQEIEGVRIYPTEYFCPMSQGTGKITITENTYCIHHYTSSWMPKHIRTASKMRRWLSRIIGPKTTNHLISIIGLRKWKNNQMNLIDE